MGHPCENPTGVETMRKVAQAMVMVALGVVMLAPSCFGQQDPGVRGGPPGAGDPVPGISDNERALFREGRLRATELEATCDGCSDITPGSPTGQDPLLQTITNSAGLGARFNADQCTACHSQPALGGSGGFLVPNPEAPPGRRRPPENPMFDLIPHRRGETNQVPSFITQYGPIREARFIRKPNGQQDGGVHQLFTVVGRSDDGTIPGCDVSVLPQPDFEAELRKHNVSFRIPLQMFGLGLIDTIQDIEILARHDATAALRSRLGISGIPNRSANDGTITRFGWKAQNKSLTMFAGEAYNVEMGLLMSCFQAVEEAAACNGPNKNHPGDAHSSRCRRQPQSGLPTTRSTNSPIGCSSRCSCVSGRPRPVALVAAPDSAGSYSEPTRAIQALAASRCHTPAMKTAAATEFEVLQDKPVNLYSDLLIHHMGPGLADRITQGLARGDMFRTTPLWGVGQRFFFLHDGRTSDLMQAILAHSFSRRDEDVGEEARAFPPSEAEAVIAAFRNLSATDKQEILDFLRSL